MHSRAKFWISMLAVLLVGSFLVGFQPIRRPHREAVPEAKFEFRLPEALTDNVREFEQKAQEVRQGIVEAGFNDEDIEHVKLLDGNRLEIRTWALDMEQETRDRENLMRALQAAYPGVVLEERVTYEEAHLQPIYQLGNVLALYPPRPQIKLGLDLQGGLHVVLRCLPYASMSFVTPEDQDQPLYAAEPGPAREATEEGDEPDDGEEGTPEETPAAGTTITREDLERRVTAELVRRGLSAEADLKVDAVAPNRLVVSTHAEDERTANAQRSAVLNLLQEMYPDYTIDPEDFESVPIEADTADMVKSIIDRRLFALGEIREPVIQKQGRDQIIVEIPGVRDPDRVATILRSTALLEFRLIPPHYENASPAEDMYDDWRDTRTGEIVGWDRVLAESDAEFRGADLVPNSRVVPGETPGSWEVTFELKTAKKRAFHEFTRRNVGRLMAIVLDGRCQMAPVIRSPIPGQGIIEGSFSAQEAGDLRLLLNAGALPVPLEIAENRTVSATLGEDAIRSSLRAGMIGLMLVLIFMVAYYGLPGLLADFALVLYLLLLIGIMAASQEIRGVGGIVLTLPGIAGIILTIGMAVDVNVIIFERLREEIRAGKTMRSAVAAGFDRAWTAILDSQLTTLIAATVLYFLGTSLIKSFATTLFIGTVCSIFTAVTVSRWLITMVAETRLGQNVALYGISDKDKTQ